MGLEVEIYDENHGKWLIREKQGCVSVVRLHYHVGDVAKGGSYWFESGNEEDLFLGEKIESTNKPGEALTLTLSDGKKPLITLRVKQLIIRT